MRWTSGVSGRPIIYTGISVCPIVKGGKYNWTATSQALTSIIQKRRPMLLGHLARVSWCQENSYCSTLEWLVKAGWTSSHFLPGHSEERPIIPQPRCGRCCQAGTGQATLVVVGSKHRNRASQTMTMMMMMMMMISCEILIFRNHSDQRHGNRDQSTNA